MNSFLTAFLAAIVITFVSVEGQASEETVQVSFAEALALQQDGKINQAIELYEALADRGVIDAAISFNRGLAYADRGRSPNQVGYQSTDLGQSVAAFIEAQHLGAEKRTSAESIKEVRTAITQRLGASKGALLELIPLKWRLLRTLSLHWLFVLSLFSSGLTTIFLCFAFHNNARTRLRARIATSFTSVALLSSTLLYSVRADLALSDQPAVITTRKAPLLLGNGKKARGYAPLSQGSLVYQLKQKGRLLKIAEDKGQGLWIQSTHLRRLALPEKP